jgi:hypothetical protein
MVKGECVCFVGRLYWESYSDYRQQDNVITQLYIYHLFINIYRLTVCVTQLLYVLLNRLHDVKPVLKVKHICYTITFLTVFIVNCLVKVMWGFVIDIYHIHYKIYM